MILGRGDFLGNVLIKPEHNVVLQKNDVSVNGSHPSEKSTLHPYVKLPAELLILNRYGIGYAYLKAAWKLSQKYDIEAFEVLVKTKIISLKTWHHAQNMLAHERKVEITKRKKKALLLSQSIHNLCDALPYYSAKRTFVGWQLLALTTTFIAISWLIYTGNQSALLIVMMFLSIFYTASILLRGLLLASFRPISNQKRKIIPIDDTELPTYSVLVALYKEANQVEALTQSLWKLDWPKHKLDIKLICEADDYETIEVILDAKLPECFELIQVTPAYPRTKPKALNYALPLCRGEYLVLYDAEDHPSPGQLKEAYAKFLSEDEKLACLQAPLHIHNHTQSWLSAMYAIEYVTLFNGILPVLAKWNVPIPLGGTSNHFKTKILKSVGAWDPYNVTEDADLGVRLFREGYRCSTITEPTYEEAPPDFIPWIKQRTRWLKGWMQTVLVHSRNPLHSLNDMGLKNTLAFHLLLTSLIVSALIHPIFLGIIIWQLIALGAPTSFDVDNILVATSIFNLVGGYTTYGLLALAVLKTSRYNNSIKLLFTLPFYWILISIAGWRAFVHLIVKPHEWEKTPHGLAK